MKQKLLIGLSLFLLFFISLSVIFVLRANQPMAKAEKKAIGIALQRSPLKKAEKFYWYNREATIYTVAGRDKSNEEILVVVPQKGKTLRLFKQADGLSEQEALKVVSNKVESGKLLRINFGLLNEEPIWEVVGEDDTGAVSYYSVSFATGDIITTVKNV